MLLHKVISILLIWIFFSCVSWQNWRIMLRFSFIATWALCYSDTGRSCIKLQYIFHSKSIVCYGTKPCLKIINYWRSLTFELRAMSTKVFWCISLQKWKKTHLSRSKHLCHNRHKSFAALHYKGKSFTRNVTSNDIHLLHSCCQVIFKGMSLSRGSKLSRRGVFTFSGFHGI